MEKFRGLAFEDVTDELEDPSEDEEAQGVVPEAMEKESRDRDCTGEETRGDTERVAGAVDRMLMTGRVPGDPLLGRASA